MLSKLIRIRNRTPSNFWNEMEFESKRSISFWDDNWQLSICAMQKGVHHLCITILRMEYLRHPFQIPNT